MFNVLVVEDDNKLNKLFTAVLVRKGYNVFSAGDGEEALNILDENYIDLIISDVMMPNVDGYELTESLREASYEIPILMITVKDDFAAKEKGFNAGIDDYMVKPVDVNEMVLRVGALMRRAKMINEKKIRIGETVMDHDSLTVADRNGEKLLPQKEFNLLYKLTSYPNKIFTRQQLMDEIWGMETDSDERTVDVHINRLREKFKDNDDFEIVTVRGLGYKMVKTHED